MRQKKKLWFDVDDVMVDTSELIELALRELTGIKMDPKSWPSHDFGSIYGMGSDRMDDLRELWQERQVLEKAPLLPGVAHEMRALAAAGYDLGLITARGWHPRGEEITWNMASEHGIPVSEVVVLGFHESKAELLRGMKASVEGYVDDTYRHVQGCLDQGWKAWLMDQPWNERHVETPRVASMAEFRQSILAMHAPKPRKP